MPGRRKVFEDEREFVIRDYNLAVKSAALEDIRLVRAGFDVKPEYFADHDTPLELTISDAIAWIDLDEAGCHVITQFDWTAECSKDKARLLGIEASYLIVYSFDRGVEKQYAEAFVGNVGRFAIYPYFRTLVAQYGAASSANMPILPIIKQPIAASSDEEQQQKRPRRPRRTQRAAAR